VFAVSIAAVFAGGVAIAAFIVASLVIPPLHLIERRMFIDGPASGAYQTAEVRLDGQRRGSVMTFRSVCFRILHHDDTWSTRARFPLAEPDFHFEWIVDPSDTSTTV
jgi:hypothetical protein